MILRNIHKTVSSEAYVDYFVKSFRNPPRLFYTIKGHGVSYIFSDRSGLMVHMVLDPTIEKDMTGHLFRLRQVTTASVITAHQFG